MMLALEHIDLVYNAGRADEVVALRDLCLKLDRGEFVTVTVSSSVPILTGSLLGFGTFLVSSSSTVIVNN